MEKVLTAPRSPWQNPFVERLVGSIRRECLDHVIVWEREIVATNSAQLFCLLSAVPNAFSLGQRRPGAQGSGTAGTGRVVAIPQVGGLHHRYQRRAAQPQQVSCIDVCLAERK
jgi:putative transposase